VRICAAPGKNDEKDRTVSTNGSDAARTPGQTWQAALRAHLDALSEDETDALRADAIRRLDHGARVRRLALVELARLSALAEYLTPRIARRAGEEPPTMAEAVLMGLMAGYQVALGEQTPTEPDLFGE